MLESVSVSHTAWSVFARQRFSSPNRTALCSEELALDKRVGAEVGRRAETVHGIGDVDELIEA